MSNFINWQEALTFSEACAYILSVFVLGIAIVVWYDEYKKR